MSQWVMHHNPRYYEQPERFSPDRWLDEQVKAAPKFAYFPFGGGPRTCIGASFAAMEAASVLAAIAQRFQIWVAEVHWSAVTHHYTPTQARHSGGSHPARDLEFSCPAWLIVRPRNAIPRKQTKLTEQGLKVNRGTA